MKIQSKARIRYPVGRNAGGVEAGQWNHCFMEYIDELNINSSQSCICEISLSRTCMVPERGTAKSDGYFQTCP